MSIKRADVEPMVGLVEMGYNSLWFVIEATKTANHTRTIKEVYDTTIGHPDIPEESRMPVFSQGFCMMAAYMLFVVPKEAHLKAFAGGIAEVDLPSLAKFTFTDGAGNSCADNFAQKLNKMRNGTAHANFEVIQGTRRLHLWNYPIGSTTKDFEMQAEMQDFLNFAQEYETAWVKWASTLP